MALSQDQRKAVYAQAFNKKLAEHGIVAAGEDQQRSLYNIAAKARKIAEAQQRRTSENLGENIKVASAFLDRHFNGDAALDALIGDHVKAAGNKGKDGKNKPVLTAK